MELGCGGEDGGEKRVLERGCREEDGEMNEESIY